MALLSDGSVGIVREVTYGTPLTVTRFYEFLSSSAMTYNPTRKVGQGLRVGSKVARSARRVTPIFDYNGNLDMELTSKGMGLLLESAFGDATSNLVSGTTYQQVFKLESTVVQPPMTLQYTPILAGGTTGPMTFTGVTIPSFEINCPNGDIVTGKFALDCQTMSTATGYATPSYASSPNLFHFAQGAVTIGGTVTAPTTTALASGGTAVANVRDFSLKVDSKTMQNRFNFGNSGKKVQPTVGLREVSGQLTIEYDSNTMRDAFLADTELAVSLTFDTGVALSSGDETLQLILSAIKLDGELPKVNGTDLIVQTVPFTVLDNLTAAEPLIAVLRTADAAL